ncbi:hypothetical protein LRS06_24715 [Hymenobacter sp. J193]|uniref:hypothetical protein n=1 Tax=Hymenobacter sp. J193 TaxID=2898429 RepID=UPI002151A3B3|nr:hypothetical protein [Hymenobacter sp. J193]MCR5890929.1 hypothetical protein [Hymenobacter sp. J193]
MQPPDWKPGDLCGHCGAVVRHESRCHWCVKLTPAGNYCRHCGAGLVPDEHYGAARWLKHLGSDQFVIPERLASMDPEQVTHFTRLYQRHANVVERHLDDMAYAEGFARQRGWVRTWEEVLLPRLPLPDEQLQALTLPPIGGTTEEERLLEIRTRSPLPVSQALAALARIRCWQASDADYVAMGLGEDMEIAIRQLRGDDPALRLEAALTLSHWRFAEAGGVFGQREVETTLREAALGPYGVEAATHLALLKARGSGTSQPVPLAALASEETDLAFAAALASFAPEPLLAALRVPRRRFAAALTLSKLGVDFELAALLPEFTADEAEQILRVLTHQQRPRPDLRAYFKAAMAGRYQVYAHTVKPMRELLLLDLRPDEAVELLREQPEPAFAAKLLQASALLPMEQGAVCSELVALNLFDPSQLPVLTMLIQSDTLPLSFIPDTFATAPEGCWRGLQTLAHHQLDAHAGLAIQPLHAFLRRLRWDSAASLRARNWAHSLLTYWYAGHSASQRPELTFTQVAATAYFPSFQEFATDFLYGLENSAVLEALEAGQRFYYPLLEVRNIEDATLVNSALMTLHPSLLDRLRTALVAFINEQGDWHPRQGAFHILNLMRQHAPWQAQNQALLEAMRGGYYDYEVQQLLAASD